MQNIQIKQNTTELYYTSIEGILSDNEFLKGLALVDNEKRNKLKRYHFVDDAKRSLCADLLIRYLAVKNTNICNYDLQFATNKYGKPYLSNSPHFNYNLSHSGQLVLCGISSNSIGVDIEQIKEVNIEIAKNFFSTKEYNMILSSNSDKQTEFYAYWTLKESYIKHIGRGLSIPLNSFCFEKSNYSYHLINNPENLSFISRNFQNNYRLAVTYKGYCTNAEIKYIDFAELLTLK